jgi:lipopolysaccharide/colanic/teichoic acid biosynthesis glycosyltransferase
MTFLAKDAEMKPFLYSNPSSPELELITVLPAHSEEVREKREEDHLLGVSSDRGGIHAAQRGVDLLLGALFLVAFFPLFLALAVAIRLETPGPVLFIQHRVGRDGHEFPFFKFRSMVHDAEAKRRALEAMNERSGPVFKMRDDPRVTRVGRLLRRTSLDELPQLLNVLRGEMSLVGPRPALPREVVEYTPRQRQRLCVTPGVTGLWQVSGRADVSFEDAVEMDLHYVQNQSLWLYIKILLLTVPAVLTGRGAY